MGVPPLLRDARRAPAGRARAGRSALGRAAAARSRRVPRRVVPRTLRSCSSASRARSSPRSGRRSRGSGRALVLEPLSDDETDALADQLLPEAALDAETHDRLVAAAEGNPLFLEQLVAHVAETGLLEPPETLRALLAARLDRLGPGERGVLERAAVVGRDFAARRRDGAARRVRSADGSRASRRARPARVHPSRRRHRVPLPPLADPRRRVPRRAEGAASRAARATRRRARATQRGRRARRLPPRARIRAAHRARRRRTAHAASCGGRRPATRRRGYPRVEAERSAKRISSALNGPSRCSRSRTRNDADSCASSASRSTRQARPTPRNARYARLRRSPSVSTIAASSCAPRWSCRGAISSMNLKPLPSACSSLAPKALPIFEVLADDRSIGRTLLLTGWVQGGMRCQHALWEASAELALEHYRSGGWPLATCIGHIAAAEYFGPAPAPSGIERCNVASRDRGDRPRRRGERSRLPRRLVGHVSRPGRSVRVRGARAGDLRRARPRADHRLDLRADCGGDRPSCRRPRLGRGTSAPQLRRAGGPPQLEQPGHDRRSTRGPAPAPRRSGGCGDCGPTGLSTSPPRTMSRHRCRSAAFKQDFSPAKDGRERPRSSRDRPSRSLTEPTHRISGQRLCSISPTCWRPKA